MQLLEFTPFSPTCSVCDRLAQHMSEVRADFPRYHCAPVPAWGPRSARLLIVGLAPGLHGANRTGRPFTGDASGRTLFDALESVGFAARDGRVARRSGKSAAGTRASGEAGRIAAQDDRVADGLDIKLIGCRITNAVRCLPPGNRPVPQELSDCRTYLAADIHDLWTPRARQNRCIVALGQLAFDSTRRALGMHAQFAHGSVVDVAPRLRLYGSYHPSRLNTNTGRLTGSMLETLFREVQAFLT